MIEIATDVPTEPDCPRDGGHDPRAIFLTWIPAVPFVAIIASVLLYAAPQGVLGGSSALGWVHGQPLLGGLAITAVAWLALAGLSWGFRLTASDQANSRSYSELCQRLRAVDSKLHPAADTLPGLSPSVLPPAAPAAGSVGVSAARQGAYSEAHSYARVINSELGHSGLRWVMGSGYLNLWRLIHRAEEAIIEFDDRASVVAGALNDKMRITNSQIDAATQTQLVTEMVQAVMVLDPTSVPSLGTYPTGGGAMPTSPPASPSVAPDTVFLLNPPTPIPRLPVAAEPNSDACERARAILRHVRFAINDFRDGQWDGLVRTRNQQLMATTLTGAITYFLVVLALAGRAGARSSGQMMDYLSDPIVAGAAFYLIGAIIGLFALLNADAQVPSQIDDYGVSTVRLLLTPVVSGLAALLGVFIVAVLPATFSNDVVTPPAITATPTPGTPVPSASPAVVQPSPGIANPSQANAQASVTPRRGTPTLDQIYNLGNNSFGLVLAAVFGLAPTALLNTIRRAPDAYKAALLSTESAGHA